MVTHVYTLAQSAYFLNWKSVFGSLFRQHKATRPRGAVGVGLPHINPLPRKEGRKSSLPLPPLRLADSAPPLWQRRWAVFPLLGEIGRIKSVAFMP
ncbi:MAG: hypothetical protein A3C07_04790 [Candidatus Sungbacteria bacterium RIFCSPHIGHO2_02_FULL_47_11]|uniref:Uncharacterized protein n=1 Tax=Candidatus Sungbacteria bacterium RIFCSPHIGHO2_02_FULL_47_11 TaxID=1802270 RepID=A0A1G2KIV1_9BACT|nr:MAG: hypothetical protein A3C07_04790 [Candidatus Sungbacteria bacterium RIFCSPHIGHO2_02_FULL_47_11]